MNRKSNIVYSNTNNPQNVQNNTEFLQNRYKNAENFSKSYVRLKPLDRKKYQ